MLWSAIATFAAAFSLPVKPADFASAASWDEAYSEPGGCVAADWLLPYDELRSALLDALSPLRQGCRLLEAGCGTSPLAAELVASGYGVVATDFSSTVIDAMREKHSGSSAVEGLSFEVADVRATSFDDATFDGVVDKGTLDAICVGEGFDYEAARASAEVSRVLRPSGLWVCVSLMPSTVIVPLLERAEWKSISSEKLGMASSSTPVHMHIAVRA